MWQSLNPAKTTHAPARYPPLCPCKTPPRTPPRGTPPYAPVKYNNVCPPLSCAYHSARPLHARTTAPAPFMRAPQRQPRKHDALVDERRESNCGVEHRCDLPREALSAGVVIDDAAAAGDAGVVARLLASLEGLAPWAGGRAEYVGGAKGGGRQQPTWDDAALPLDRAGRVTLAHLCVPVSTLYCTVLYCTVLYCTVLYRAVLCCTVLHRTVPY
eukprot:360666-Chlamydomonas_euryale.AAC.15